MSDHLADERANTSALSQKERMIMERRHDNFLKSVVAEFQDTQAKIRHFFTAKLEKNWRRVNDKLQKQKTSADDFLKLHLFMQVLVENLRTQFKVSTINIAAVSEDYQKKYLIEFSKGKTEELKQILDSETWTQAQVSPYFQGLVDRINSVELFESQTDPASADKQPRDTLAGPEGEYKVLMSTMKLMSMVHDFLRLIASFPDVAFDGTSKLLELIKVSTPISFSYSSTTARRATLSWQAASRRR